MRASAAERREVLLEVGWRAAAGFAAPPLVTAVAVWSAVVLSGMQRPELAGLFAHLTGESVPVVIAPARLAEERVVDRGWLDGTTATFAAMGMGAAGDHVVQRAAYRGWLRLFEGPDPTEAAFAVQTTYPGAPPPNIAIVSACSPPGSGEPVAGASIWVETSDEYSPDGDTGYPRFLRIVLDPDLDPPALLARHRAHVAEVCAGAPPIPIVSEQLLEVIAADRQWWFDWCAQSLFGMVAECRPEGEQPR